MTSILTRNKANNSTARVPMTKKPRSIFPMSFYRKQTMKCSYLTPIFFEEVLPSDTWIVNIQHFCRLATQIAPPMDNLWVKTYFFYVPYRQVWDNFPKQHGERENPDDTIDYITPKIKWNPSGITAGTVTAKSIYDYMELPLGFNGETTSLGYRAYNRIYNQYFRSERLQNSVYENHTDTDDNYDKFKLLKIGKMHDYFTDCLPDLQLGEEVKLPLGDKAWVYGIDSDASTIGWGAHFMPLDENSGTIEPKYYGIKGDASLGAKFADNTGTVYTGSQYFNIINKTNGNELTNKSGIYADLSNAVASTITAMRNAIDLQTVLERDNRNGTRYTELLQARYGAVNPDLRMFRPQYLGGTSAPLTTTPVVQNSGTGTTGQNTPQGNLAGYGQTYDKGNVIKASFGEFGCILGLAVIQAVPQYQQGISRKHTRFERFDYYYPEFAGMSDQAVLNKEIYWDGSTNDDKVFGYIPRYDEYRYFNNHICGELRSTYTNSLDVWHYAEKFETRPALNGDFITDKASEIVPRTLAVMYEDENETPAEQIIAGFEFKGTVTRVMPSKAIPTTGGRIL